MNLNIPAQSAIIAWDLAITAKKNCRKQGKGKGQCEHKIQTTLALEVHKFARWKTAFCYDNTDTNGSSNSSSKCYYRLFLDSAEREQIERAGVFGMGKVIVALQE